MIGGTSRPIDLEVEQASAIIGLELGRATSA